MDRHVLNVLSIERWVGFPDPPLTPPYVRASHTAVRQLGYNVLLGGTEAGLKVGQDVINVLDAHRQPD